MYSLDLKNISLETYRDLLAGKDLLPGRRLLHQNLNENISRIAAAGIKNLSGLKKALSSPDKIRSFSVSSGVSEEYLILLKREAGSLEQKPVPLADFSGIDANTLGRLQQSGLKTSKDFYEFYIAAPDAAARKTGVSPEEARRLFSLCDLVRINGVGAAAARTFLDAGYPSVFKVTEANAAQMLKEVSFVNSQSHYYNANLGEKDMQFCIDYAKILLQFSHGE